MRTTKWRRTASARWRSPRRPSPATAASSAPRRRCTGSADPGDGLKAVPCMERAAASAAVSRATLPFHHIAFLYQQLADAFALIALQFHGALVDRPPGAARALELLRQV